MSELVSLSVSVEQHVATVTMVGPGRGNAMGPDFFRELPEVFGELDADPQVRAVVLTGSGEHFSYGLDLPAMAPLFGPLLSGESPARQRTDFLRDIHRLQAAISSIADCRTPVVAAITGWCIGGGVDVAAAADIRLASADAKFSVREVRVAIVADLGSLQRLGAIVGDGNLRDLALTGRDIDATHAERIGLVTEVHPDAAALRAAAIDTARLIAANPPLVVQGVKNVLDHERSTRIADGLRYVAAWNAAFLPSKDLGEAMAAFAQRRAPEFTGE